MTKQDLLKPYKIAVSHPREITVWEDLKIEIYIRLTDEEKELMERQNLQINEQIMLPTGWAKTISYTHMIEHIIEELPHDFKEKEKIIVNHDDENDKTILKKWMEQLLNETEKHILRKR